jgi:CYTH domain-containing protein/CHAD domain-containing protein
VAEIERKFLVREMPRAESGSSAIEQGYLALDASAEVRLRRIGGELLLTAKTGSGESREEVEVPIAPRAFEALWPLTAGRRVRKVRHYVPLPGDLRAEVDVYAGALDGLLTAEVEFDSLAEADRFQPPAWIGEELTGDERYANRALATEGLPADAVRRDDVPMETTATSDAATGAAPEPSRAYKLHAGEGAAAGMRRVVAGRLDKAAERLREPGDGDALAEAIHGVRKDLKKARAALRLIREELGEKTFKRENQALRDAGRLLSASRDAEVKLETIDSLIEGVGDAPPAATALWRDALTADRDRIVGGGKGADDATAAALAAIEQVAARLPGWKIRRGSWKLLSPGLDTAYREGREELRSLLAEPDVDAVHDLRKRGKDLWYQVRLLAPAWPEVLDTTAGEIHDFTDKLGDHHDLAVLAEDLDGRDAVYAAQREILHALIEARQATLLAEARALGERIYAEKPKALTHRLHAYWRAWRR